MIWAEGIPYQTGVGRTVTIYTLYYTEDSSEPVFSHELGGMCLPPHWEAACSDTRYIISSERWDQ